MPLNRVRDCHSWQSRALRDSPFRKASTALERTIKADRSREFKSRFLSFWRGRNVPQIAHAAGILTPPAHALGQDLRDDPQSPGRGEEMVWREVIALDRLGVVDDHECVRARARGGQRWSVVPARQAAGCQPPSTQTVRIVAKGGPSETSDDPTLSQCIPVLEKVNGVT